MGQGTCLSDAEVAKIRTIHEEGNRPAEIERRVTRSCNAIVNALNQKISKAIKKESADRVKSRKCGACIDSKS